MEAKLIKKNDIFYLYVDESWSIASTDVKDNRDKKLSLKNCQEIERGYDLGELANERSRLMSLNSMFKAGFQKALSIIGDKKYSEDDVKKAMDIAINYEIKRDAESYQEKIDFLKSLQQTEWDVEIVTTKRMENGKSGLDVPIIKPKLDADGCLILKRKI